ncbi:Z1 domain-containing protein [Tardiphaga sp. 11_C7_N12_6]|uniref:Z1 domain-containing protein n=1 Tax=Tardiphaga sp. 11_C7_N12_6 TaxID=3240789 RepID=UPI003F289680
MTSLEETIGSMATILLRQRHGTTAVERIDIAAAIADCQKAFPTPLTSAQISVIQLDLESKLIVKVGRTTRLIDETGHVDWYFGAKKSERRFYKRYEDFLLHNQGWAHASVAAIDASTDAIMEQLEDPARDGPWDRRGLVVGHVQSGKTANYAALANKAADAGYKLVVVLAGMHNALRQQTQRRLDRDFLGYDTTPPSRGQGYRSIGVSEFDRGVFAEHLTTQAPNGDFNQAFADNLGMGVQQRPVLMVVKKNAKILANLNNWVSEKLTHNGDTETRPLLVIDDEADQASVDTGQQDFGDDETPDPDYEPTRINGQIRRLLFAFSRKAYVAYTATPFANILIHDKATTDDFGSDLFPRSFIVNLPTPSNYVGPSQVFGSNTDDSNEDSLDIIRHVNQDQEGWMLPTHKKTFVPQYRSTDVIPPSLQQAILSFVLVCAARNARGQSGAHNSMLIHVSRFKDVQKKVYSQVDEWFLDLKRSLRYKTGDRALLEECKILWIKDFEPTSAVFRSKNGAAETGNVAWDEVKKELAAAADRIRLQVVNSEMPAAIDYEGNTGQGLNIIAIGGDKLSRGLTLEGLSVSYFLRASKMYDSLMQMGRWFGYRPGYADLCRVYLTPDLELWFRHVATAAEELRERLNSMAMIGATPENYGLRIQAHDIMLVTAQNKMRHGETFQISFQGEAKIQTVLYDDETNNVRNATSVASFLDRLGSPTQPSRAELKNEPFKLFKGKRIWSGVTGAAVANLLAEMVFPEESREVNGIRLAKYIREQLKVGELTDWTIAVPSGDGEKSTVSDWHFTTVNRSPIPRGADTGRYVVKTSLSPSDEAIDLSANEFKNALAETNKKRARAGKREAKLPDGPEIRRTRGTNPRRALLILYALSPKAANLKLAVPVFSVVVSFPDSESGQSVRYVFNTTEQRFEPA